MNWRELPFVRMFLFFASGIGFAIFGEVSIPYPYVISSLLLVILLFCTRSSIPYSYRWIHGLTLYAFLFLAGQQLYWSKKDDQQAQHFSQFLDQENTLVGLVAEVPTSTGDYQRCQLEVWEISSNQYAPVSVRGKLHLTISNPQKAQPLIYGDVVRLQTKIRLATSPKNPQQFDFAWHLQTQNCYFQAFLNPDDFTLLAQQQGSPILHFAAWSRQQLISILRQHIPGTYESAVAIALSLGDRSYIDPELKAAYASTGAIHVLAVSGLHVGLVYLALSWLLTRAGITGRPWRFLRTFILLAGVGSYALLTGASPSVLRATTMFCFLIVGEQTKRSTNLYNTLAVSAFCLLWINPNLIISLGFQLSYAAVVGIVFFQPKIYRLWYIDHWLGDQLWKLTSVSIAAQLITLPITIYHFHQFPIYFWLSGWVVVPAAMLILPLCFCLFISHAFLPIIVWPISQLLYGVLWLSNAVIFFISDLPFNLIQDIWISGSSFLFCYLLLACLAGCIQSNSPRWKLATLFCILGLVSSISLKNIQHQNQEQLVIYHHRKKALIDLFYGNNLLSLQDSTWQQKELDRTAAQHRAFSGTHLTEVRYITNQEQTFTFAGKRWHILRRNQHLPKQIDHLFIHRLGKQSLESVLQASPELIIFGAANSPKEVQRWVKRCQQLGIQIYNIQTQGAFIFPSSIPINE